MTRQQVCSILFVAVFSPVIWLAGCGQNSAGLAASPPDPAAGIYDEFLESRTLATSLASAHPELDLATRERKVVEDRRALRNLETAVASKRAILADSRRDSPADRPNESLYFQIWSGHFGNGPTPVFRRLAGGGIEYGGRQFTKDTAMQCAVPARFNGYTHTAFVECLKTLQTEAASR